MEYPDWLANVVVVPKKEGKWRVCVDYTNLNNACPKDNFPLPRIDHIVDSTARQGMLSFLDAFSRYHQIPMAPANEENTAFITPHGIYCYKVMPFRLKNAGATYQRLMTKIFKPLVGCIVEVYINDIVVKSKTRGEHALHLRIWQVMADFVVEYSQKPAQHKEPREEEWWTLRVDEASRSLGSRVGLLLQSPTGEQLEQAIRLGFPASNNEVEYEAILSGLDLALALFVSKLWIYSDSQLVVRQAQEEYGAKDERMACYLTKVRHTLQRFSEWTIEKIPRTDNVRADALAGIAASLPIKEAILLPIHVQTDPSITEASTCNTIKESQGDD